MVEAFGESEIRERLAAARRVRTELPFVYSLDGVLVNGVVDVHAEEDEGLLVVDYKSDPVEGLDLEAYCAERYATQRLVYALAALRSGAERVEVSYVFLERPGEPVSGVFVAGDVERLIRSSPRWQPACSGVASCRARSPIGACASGAPAARRSVAMMRR